MRYIPLVGGGATLVDDADYERLSQWSWRRLVTRSGNVYAYRVVYGEPDQFVYMHREIAQPLPGQIVDHRNRNGLDNRRENLRRATRTQNNANARARSTRTPYKGVNLVHGRWMARIKRNCQAVHLGYYDTAEEAARAYDRAARELFGEYARLNFEEAT